MTDKAKPTAWEAKINPFSRLLSSIKQLVDPTLPIEDRRGGGRLACSYESSFVTEHGETGRCEVVDVSRRGLQLITENPLAKGLTVAIKTPETLGSDAFASVMTKVMWTRKDQDQRFLSGVLLPPGIEDEETWLEAILSKSGYRDDGSQRRKFVRAESEISGRLALDGETPFEVMVLNLGMGGALIKCEQSLPAERHFVLELGPFGDLPDIEISGTILRETDSNDGGPRLYSSRFGPLEKRRHSLLQEYILTLLKKP